MKRLLYFIPVILFAALYLLMFLCGLGMISIRQGVWLALFLLSGTLLARGHFWGGAFGLIPAIDFILMSTRDSGQVVNIEFPLGAALAVYYISCSIAAYKKRREG